MSRSAPWVGALGAGALLAGVFLYATQPARETAWVACLVGGLAGVGWFVVARWSSITRFWQGRSAKEGTNSALLVLFVLGILGAINYIASNHPKQWDLTAARQHTLSEQTIQLLDGLQSELRIVLLDVPARAIEPADLLELYDDQSPLVTTEIIDPEADPERALAYQNPTEPGITLGTVIVDTGERTERAIAATEPEITNAILRVLNEKRKKIYFTGGHGEKELDDSEPQTGLSVMKARLRDSLYDAETLVLSRTAASGTLRVPEDADAVVVAGPRTDFAPEEIEALDRYVRRGGHVVFLVDPATQAETPALVTFLREQGAEIGDDIVIDRYSNPPAYPVVGDYGNHPIVESFRNTRSIFPLVRTVSRAADLPEGVGAEELFSTPDNESWAETRIEELETRGGPAEDQTRGPLSLAVALTIPVEAGADHADGEGDGKVANGEDGGENEPADAEAETETETEKRSARVVVVGDSDFITNELAQAPILNADLFLNMVNWVAQDEELMAIRPREPEDRRIFMSQAQTSNVMLLTLLVLPGILVVTGISVWWGRR